MDWKPISEKPEEQGWYLLWYPMSYSPFSEAYWEPELEWDTAEGGATHWCEVEGPNET
jgi:hypothetical protein